MKQYKSPASESWLFGMLAAASAGAIILAVAAMTALLNSAMWGVPETARSATFAEVRAPQPPSAAATNVNLVAEGFGSIPLVGEMQLAHHPLHDETSRDHSQ